MLHDQAHRPPSPDFWKTQNSKAPVPSANGGSVQRPCSATCSFHHKNLRPTLSGSAVTAGLATAQRIKPRMTRMDTDKNIHVIRAMILRLPIPQEETEDRVRLRRLRCLLFTAPGVPMPPNDPATRPARRVDCNSDAMAGFAAAHGLIALTLRTRDSLSRYCYTRDARAPVNAILIRLGDFVFISTNL